MPKESVYSMQACSGDKRQYTLSTPIVHLPNVEQLGVLRGLRCMSPKDLLRLLYAKSIQKNRPTKETHIKKKILSTEMPILVDRTCKKLLLSIEMGILVDRGPEMHDCPRFRSLFICSRIVSLNKVP